MYCKDLIINDGSQAHVVKDLTAVPPNRSTPKLAYTLIVKPVYLGDLSAFVVASDKRDTVWVAHLEG